MSPSSTSNGGRLRTGTPVRALPNVLRQALAAGADVRLELGEVTANPDLLHVTVAVGGDEVTVPKLSSYSPVVGEPCYLLTSRYWTLALGTVSDAPPATGPQGPPGPEGPPGPTGPQGATGSQGPPGAQGAKGDTGAQGPQGAAGAQGPKGDTGSQGPAGAQGPKGDTGAQGIQGPAGPSGASTFVSGAGAPTAGVGVDGAIYLDTATRRLWGPKTAGAWPSSAFARAMPLQPTYRDSKGAP
jgi:hypothetical protein